MWGGNFTLKILETEEVSVDMYAVNRLYFECVFLYPCHVCIEILFSAFCNSFATVLVSLLIG